MDLLNGLIFAITMQDDITSEALPDAQGVSVSDSKETASVESTDNQGEATPSIAKVLSETLGKTFETDEQALKAVKDTNAYVSEAGHYQKFIKTVSETQGVSRNEAKKIMETLMDKAINEAPAQDQVAEQPVGENTQQLAELHQKVQDMEFFKANPKMEKHEALLKELRGTSGKSFEAIMESEVFKDTLDKVSAHDELESKKTVLHSNSRLGKATNKMDEARKAVNSGDTQGARKNAVSAVIDAFDLQ